VHDLRHTAASVWLGARADPKGVQRVLGHATASMTMDLYGHPVDANLREVARAIGGILGHLSRLNSRTKTNTTQERKKVPGNSDFSSRAAYRNRTDDLRITSASLWPTELRRRAALAGDFKSLPVPRRAPQRPAGREIICRAAPGRASCGERAGAGRADAGSV